MPDMKETEYYNLMKDFEAEEIEPMVGIFWYLPENDFIFEIGKHWELGHGWNEDQLNDFFGD